MEISKHLGTGILATSIALGGCGKIDAPVTIGIAMEGYSIECAKVLEGHTPLNKKICDGKKPDDRVEVSPSVYRGGVGSVEEYLDGLFGPVINFDILSGMIDGLRPNTLFIGGETDGDAIGKTSIFPNLVGMDHGLSYVTDTWRDKNGNLVAQPPYVVTQTLGHEIGHFLISMSTSDAGVGGGNDHQKEVALLATYQHDDDQHDMTGPYMMAGKTLDYNTNSFYRFSNSSAKIVQDHLNFDGTNVEPDEYANALRQADFYYDTQLAALKALVPAPIDEN